MSFAVLLADDLAQVEPGATTPVAFEVANRTDARDQYEIEVEGLDPSWTAVPVPSFSLEAREIHTERLFIKPPRESESLAGTYPFVVKVRSLETGETKTAQGMLEVKPYVNMSLEIQPRRGTVSPFAKEASFQVSVMNQGNGEQTVQMFATDPEGLFAFEFDADQVTLAPGQTREVSLTTVATKSSLLANSRLTNFSVTARSTLNPAVASGASGQIEQKALASPASFLLVLTVLGLALAWLLAWPRSPVISSVVASPGRVVAGQDVTLQWVADHARAVSLRVYKTGPGGIVEAVRQDRLPERHAMSFKLTEPGEYTVEIQARSGNMSTRDDTTRIVVEEAPVSPEPRILQFEAESRSLKLGQAFLLRYKFNDSVVRALLLPMQKELDVREDSIRLTADEAGRLTFTLKAFNDQGRSVEQQVTLNVQRVSEARIAKFTVSPKELPTGGGEVLVEWAVVDALRIELVFAGSTTTLEEAAGARALSITESTQFKLVAYDRDNVAVASEAVTVKVQPAEPPTPPAGETTGGSQGP